MARIAIPAWAKAAGKRYSLAAYGHRASRQLYWRVGCGPVVSKLTSFTRRALVFVAAKCLHRVAVSREHHRAKTDRLDAELVKRAFIVWLRGEPNHCSMVPIPNLEEEDTGSMG